MNDSSTLLESRKKGVVVGLFYKPAMGTTGNVTGRMGTTIGDFMAGFVVTLGPRVAGSCTSNGRGCVVVLVFRKTQLSCCVLLLLSLPVVVGARCVLAL